MNLQGNYFKGLDDGHDGSFILVLDFNDCSAVKIQQIIDVTVDFADKNLINGECYFASYGGKRGKKFPEKLTVSADDFDISYTVSGMILPDKKLRKEILETSLSRPLIKVDKQALLNHLIDGNSYVCTTNPVDDFSLTFKRMSWDDECAFECIISVSCYSLGYNYSEITELYRNLIKEMSGKFDLYAAYIDSDGFGMGYLLYEYCYSELIEKDETFEYYRTYPWGGYISESLLKHSSDIERNLINAAKTERLENGMYFNSISTPENFDYFQRSKIYNVLRPILMKSYGIVPVDHLIESGFKPCEETVYLFDDFFHNLYVCFSNGVNLIDILRREKERFKYIGELDVLGEVIE